MIGQVETSTILLAPPVWENPHMEKDLLRERIQERLAAIGKTPHAVSIEIGAGQGYVRDLLDPAKGGFPRADKLNALARALGTTVDYLSGISASPEAVLSEVGISDRRIEWRAPRPDLPPIPLVGTGDCANIEFEDETGQLVDVERSSFDPDHTVMMIARPPALRGVPDLYAIFFVGESMMPRYEPGDVGIVDPNRPARPGDYVLVQLNNGSNSDVISVLAKRLVRQNAREVVLEQFNPPLKFTVPRSKVTRLHRILPNNDALMI